MGKYDKIKLPQEEIRNFVRLEFIELYEDKKNIQPALDVLTIHECFTKALPDYTLKISELEIILEDLSKAPTSGVRKSGKDKYRGE